MMSGSFVASLLFTDALDYNDFDLYFTKERFKPRYQTVKSSLSFELQNKLKMPLHTLMSTSNRLSSNN